MIQDKNGRCYYVDEYSPQNYLERGEYLEILVYVKAFRKRNGDIGYSFNFQIQQEQINSRGVRF